MAQTRTDRLKRALYRGEQLTFENREYRHAAQTLLQALVEEDVEGGDVTAEALDLGGRRRSAQIVAHEAGIAAGLQEIEVFLEGSGLRVSLVKKDGDAIRPGDLLLEAKGNETQLLSFERVGLNLLQRMSGIATGAHCLQERASRVSAACVVGTRKTPWGWLDKRALHVAGCGTHRLSLGDAILIKNNHLALFAGHEEEAVPLAIDRAWENREGSAFIEVEVRSAASAQAAAQNFRRHRQESREDYPCLLMLDNMLPRALEEIVRTLQSDGLWDDTLVEASGGISESAIEDYAATGVDAISIGALTHSSRALDISQRIS